MKAISLWQPWAQWIALEWKTIETRTHDKFHRLEGERIAIHAAKKWDPDSWEIAKYFLSMEQWAQTRQLRILNGSVICTAYVRRHRLLMGEPEENRAALCGTIGRYGLFLEDIKPIKTPMPWRGQQGIFYIPDEIINEIPSCHHQ